jgi:arylsulfatase A-like enzyme
MKTPARMFHFNREEKMGSQRSRSAGPETTEGHPRLRFVNPWLAGPAFATNFTNTVRSPAASVSGLRALCVAGLCWFSGETSGQGFAAETPAARPPNIIFILADDIGYGDLGSYGAKKVKTPHLDRLAAQGQRFTQAYAPASACTPTRYALLTGRYAWRTTNARGVIDGDAPLVIPPDTFTLPDLLQRAGYRTGCVGKWHLGFGPRRTDYNAELKPGPLELGFDYFYGIPATGDRVPTIMIENHRVAGLDPADPLRIDYKKKIGDEPTGLEQPAGLKLAADRQHSGTIVNGISRIGFMTGGRAARWRDEDVAGLITAKAVAFIEQNQAAPFFLYFATHDIHAPRFPHPRFMQDSQLGYRGGAIAQLDWTVGEILATLARLGLEENTLVIFSSDNGGATGDGYREAGLGDHRFNGPLRGLKSGLWEGGSRVPFIARWPARLAAGGEPAAIVSHQDLFATFAELTGQPLPADAAPDSLSFLPALLGRGPVPQARRHLVLQNGSGTELALRDGDWKYIPDLETVGGWYRDDSPGLTGPGLYDLARDPGERENLAAARPAVLQAMRDKLSALRKRSERVP